MGHLSLLPCLRNVDLTYDPSRSPHRSDVERLADHLLAHVESHPGMAVTFKRTPLELPSVIEMGGRKGCSTGTKLFYSHFMELAISNGAMQKSSLIGLPAPCDEAYGGMRPKIVQR